MRERAELITWLRSELVGPSLCNEKSPMVEMVEAARFEDQVGRRGVLGWRPPLEGRVQEVLYYQHESPHRKYGAGLLHAPAITVAVVQPDKTAADATEAVPVDEAPEEGSVDVEGKEDPALRADELDDDATAEFDVTSPDIRHPCTMGISFCVKLSNAGQVTVRLPSERRFSWQEPDATPFPVNGWYESGDRTWKEESGTTGHSPFWRRRQALPEEASVTFEASELTGGKVIRKAVQAAIGSPVELTLEVFPRELPTRPGTWLLTVVLRNTTANGGRHPIGSLTLFQSYFEIVLQEACFERYPESQRPFSALDADEQSLALLYRDAATWGIGHGCAAAWDCEAGRFPSLLYADVMPAVETPSMTPDVYAADGTPIVLSMRILAGLADDGTGEGWEALKNLCDEYQAWISRQHLEAEHLSPSLQGVASRHLEQCNACLTRMRAGLHLLGAHSSVRAAFRLANLAMLLQQIATKQLVKRSLSWDSARRQVFPNGACESPWDIYATERETSSVGKWRAFQAAFLLMSLSGIVEEESDDRDIVDLIWFPTGGGKTEAYLAVMALHIFHQRLAGSVQGSELRVDGTNVLMRYTLRMLTTQQFQRAASLICAMEYLRRTADINSRAPLPGQRFSLGLWIGGAGSPNSVEQARAETSRFRADKTAGNPLVLTECPWCRAQIGKCEGDRPTNVADKVWKQQRFRGVADVASEGPLLHCPDNRCAFGQQDWTQWLPIEVIDERIYREPPSIVIATADKFAMIAFRPEAGAIFGRQRTGDAIKQVSMPPGLVVQDELHLIFGPLGTVYALYEGIIERLCSYVRDGALVRPKLIASTATIRGAADQVRALYARVDDKGSTNVQLFPSPGLSMGDSFFGTYARGTDHKLLPGRMYLGIHANEYGSLLTAQVRTFASVAYHVGGLPVAARDPWWTLLAFYNSIRELGGAKTLFESDIRSRLKYMSARDGIPLEERRHLKRVEELTSRLAQSEIVAMMDDLAVGYASENNEALDACLASSIIEVGVDIDRLSLMGVVGQPKSTAQYIQVTGRVGRRWSERPGLILMVYGPSKSRDRSHFEQFHSYHRRLYERVEPTSATPFAVSALQRALAGVLIYWARQQSAASVLEPSAYRQGLEEAAQLLERRCAIVMANQDSLRPLDMIKAILGEVQAKWAKRPQEWHKFPPAVDGEYLMLWPGQFSSTVQRERGVIVLSSMRQVDGSSELEIRPIH